MIEQARIFKNRLLERIVFGSENNKQEFIMLITVMWDGFVQDVINDNYFHKSEAEQIGNRKGG